MIRVCAWGIEKMIKTNYEGLKALLILITRH